MPLFLSNADQAQCITPREAVDVLEDAIRQFARGEGIRRPRIDNILPTSRPAEYFNFSSMEGGYNVRLKDGRLKPGYYALRIKPDIYSFPVVDGMRRQVTYSYRPGLYGGLVFLYSVDNAEFLAIMNDGFVQHMRVAASVGLGIRYLSRTDSRVMGIIGSGGMARVFPGPMVRAGPRFHHRNHAFNKDTISSDPAGDCRMHLVAHALLCRINIEPRTRDFLDALRLGTISIYVILLVFDKLFHLHY